MFKEGLLDKILLNIKKLIPRSVFNFFAPIYHVTLAYTGAVLYGFPSRSMKIIGVTGTKGKSTTVFLISRVLEAAMPPSDGGIAAIGSLGFKIREKEWPNTLKMTMPGRFRLQKFLAQAKKAGCRYVVVEVTSEGIKQKRHLGIKFDCAVFTNLHREHIESHGSFEKYLKAKQELFNKTENLHVLNADDPRVELFSRFYSKRTIFYGIERGDLKAKILECNVEKSIFEVYGIKFDINLGGEFNIYNCLAALATVTMYGVDLSKAKSILESIELIPGRMEVLQKNPFKVIVDYAHTPDSLQAVYNILRKSIGSEHDRTTGLGMSTQMSRRLICVLGAAGGGRDKWKRPEFGRLASQYCDEIFLTNEDSYDESPSLILQGIEKGFSSTVSSIFKILDRQEAIKKAINNAKPGDTVIITGKGSETSMALAGGKRLPWSDKEIVQSVLKNLTY